MKAKLYLLLILFLATINTSLAFQKGQDHKILFEKAVYTMETKADLKEAITLFDSLILTYPNEREYAANAQFHIGLCYEKLGLNQAQQAYQKVLDNYPNQQGEVALAKERLIRLLALQEVPAKPSFRKIRIPTKPRNGILSPDGEKLAFTSQGSVWVVPVQGKVQPDLAGEPYRLTEPMGANNFNNSLAWSGDGTWIAFHAQDDNKGAIYIVSVIGGKLKKIPVEINNRGDTWFSDRLSLSPDGKILAFCSLDLGLKEVKPEEEYQFSIYTISLDDGKIKHLTDNSTEQPAFSSDGRMIAYVKRYKSKEGKRFSEGWVIPASGGTPIRLTDSSKYASGPIWSPDSKMVAYTCIRDTRHGDMFEILVVPLSEKGQPSGSPKVIELPEDTYMISAGWSLNNKIGFHLVNPRIQAIYTVPLSGGKATQVTPEGWANNPCWALDGKRLFFRWDTGTIASIPAEGGEVSLVPIQSDEKIFTALPGGGHHISPDGKMMVFAGVYAKDSRHVHIMTMPSEGGEPVMITESPRQDRFPCWSPDGEQIAFIRYQENTKGKIVTNICIVPSAGGGVKQITSEEYNVNWSSIKFLPDGKHIVYFSNDSSIKMIPVQGGEPKEIVKVKSLNSHNEIIILNDGKQMVYSSGWKIWTVSLDGGVPTQIKTGLDNWHHSQIAQSKDGKKIAFTAFNVRAGDSDLWIMEDFLPKTEARK